jgi:hypothetical protein
MLSTFQIAAVSAVLSGLVVGIWDADARTPANATTKAFVDRVPETAIETGVATGLSSAEQRRPTQSAGRKGDRNVSAGSAGCDEAWPYIPQECLHLAGGAEPRTSVRMITVETRAGEENTSILMRMAQTAVAAR